MADGASGEDLEYLAPRISLISILYPLVRIAAVAWALFSFLGISLAGGGSMFVPHIPGLALIILALVPASFARKSVLIYVATVVVALIGASLSIDFTVRYSEPAWLLDVLLYALFLVGLTLARRRTKQTLNSQESP
jgi:hypothetical protein